MVWDQLEAKWEEAVAHFEAFEPNAEGTRIAQMCLELTFAQHSAEEVLGCVSPYAILPPQRRARLDRSTLS